MAIYQAKMERKQGFLFRTVDIVMELFAMTAAISRARSLVDARSAEAEQALALADLFCRNASRKVDRIFVDLWRNDDDRKNDLTKGVMNGDFAWLEEGRLDVGLEAESFETRFMTRASERGPSAAVGSGLGGD